MGNLSAKCPLSLQVRTPLGLKKDARLAGKPVEIVLTSERASEVKTIIGWIAKTEAMRAPG